MVRSLFAASMLAVTTFAGIDAAGAQEKCPRPTSRIVVGSHINGESLVQSDDSSLQSFISGFTEGVLASGLYGVRNDCIVALDACVQGRSSKQLTAIVRKYLKENPSKWHASAGLLLDSAIFEPCTVASGGK